MTLKPAESMQGDGVRGHVNKALDYATAPSAHAEYLIVNRTARDQQSSKEKIIRIMKSLHDTSYMIGVGLNF